MLTGVKHQRIYQAMSVIAALGIIASGYALYAHFSNTSSFCNINARFNCDTVNRGRYAEIFGVPVAFFGIISYAFIFILCIEQFKDRRRMIKIVLALLLGCAVGFSAHLAWISSELLQTWCIVCITSYAITAVLAGLFAIAEI